MAVAWIINHKCNVCGKSLVFMEFFLKLEEMFGKREKKIKQFSCLLFIINFIPVHNIITLQPKVPKGVLLVTRSNGYIHLKVLCRTFRGFFKGTNLQNTCYAFFIHSSCSQRYVLRTKNRNLPYNRVFLYVEPLQALYQTLQLPISICRTIKGSIPNPTTECL